MNVSSPFTHGMGVYDVSSSPGGGSVETLPHLSSALGGGSPTGGANSSAGRNRALQNSSYKKGCKRPRFGEKMAPLGTTPDHWCDCKDKQLQDASDSELAEYLIGYCLEFTLPQEFWPRDKGHWEISCSDTHIATAKDVKVGFRKGDILMVGLVMNGPRLDQIRTSIKIPMSGKYSI